MGRRLTMVCVQITLNHLSYFSHGIIHTAHSFSSSVVRIFVHVSYTSHAHFLNKKKAFIPLWILPSSFGALSAGAFWIQFGVQGAWGVVRSISRSSLYSTTTANRSKRNVDSYSSIGDVSTRISSDFPWCRLSAWERTSYDSFSYFFILVVNIIIRSNRWSRQLHLKLKRVRWNSALLKLIINNFQHLVLAGGNNLRTTINVNGVPTNVPNLGAVSHSFPH